MFKTETKSKPWVQYSKIIQNIKLANKIWKLFEIESLLARLESYIK